MDITNYNVISTFTELGEDLLLELIHECDSTETIKMLLKLNNKTAALTKHSHFDYAISPAASKILHPYMFTSGHLPPVCSSHISTFHLFRDICSC